MRTSEHQCVDRRIADRRQQTLREDVHLVGVDVAGLDELDEAGARRAREVDARQVVGDALVRARRDGADGADHPDATAARDVPAARRPGSITPITGMSSSLLERVERGGGRAVARDDEELHALVEQHVGDLERVGEHLLGRLRPVREAPGVAEVDDALVGQQVDHRAQDGEPTEPGVEHADGLVAHRGP